jgi:hypothetical protein
MRSDGIVVSPPVLDQDLSLTQCREDLAVEKLGIMEQAHHFWVWRRRADFGFNAAWSIRSSFKR